MRFMILIIGLYLISAAGFAQPTSDAVKPPESTELVQRDQWADKCWPDTVGPISCFREYQNLWGGILALSAGILALTGAWLQARASTNAVERTLRYQEDTRKKDEDEKRKRLAHAFLAEVCDVFAALITQLHDVKLSEQSGQLIIVQHLLLYNRTLPIYERHAADVILFDRKTISPTLNFYNSVALMRHDVEHSMELHGALTVAPRALLTEWKKSALALTVKAINLQIDLCHIAGTNYADMIANRAPAITTAMAAVGVKDPVAHATKGG
jgi:hypothetical protein